MLKPYLLHSYSPLPFGKFKGYQLGMIYLLAPNYINWMLEETVKANYCVGDIEFLQSLKVINRFGESGWLAHHTEVDVEEFRRLWRPYVSFSDMKFSGTSDYSFSGLALATNTEKLSHIAQSKIAKLPIVPEDRRKPYIFYPGTSISTEKASLVPLAISTNSKKSQCIDFLLDNDSSPLATTCRIESYRSPLLGQQNGGSASSNLKL